MTRLQSVSSAPERSLWLEEALALESDDERVEPLHGSERADVCIVGGGYTGLWTALRIKEIEPAVDVVLLEADICGAGASGRNGGFTQSWWTKLGSLVKHCGEDEGVRLGHAAANAVAEIGAFCDRHGIDAHFRRDGWLWTATTRLHIGAWDGAIRECERRGIEAFQRLSAEEIAARTGSAVHVAGVFEPGSATVQPALLARGLRRVAIERGVRVYERSPVLRLDEAAPPVVRTPNGAVVATKVVLATNAWLATIPDLRRALIVLSSDMVATAPIPARLAAIGWTGGESISDARLMVQYYRTTGDGRIAIGRGSGALAFGGRVTPGFDGDRARSAEVIGGLRRLFPMLADVPITHEWAGAVDRSETGLPFFGHLPGKPHVLYGAGYSGNGVGPSRVGGCILASAALERRDEWSSNRLNQGPIHLFPPEPIRYFGGRVVRAAVKQREETEERGAHANPLVSRVAALAPAGMRKGGRG